MHGEVGRKFGEGRQNVDGGEAERERGGKGFSDRQWGPESTDVRDRNWNWGSWQDFEDTWRVGAFGRWGWKMPR